MQIASADISINSQYSSFQHYSVSEAAHLSHQSHSAHNPLLPDRAVSAPRDTVSLSPDGKEQSHRLLQQQGIDHQASQQQKLSVLMHLLEKVTGQKLNIINPHDLNAEQPVPAQSRSDLSGQPSHEKQTLAYARHQQLYQSEQFNFSAQGTLTTTDGQEINFNLSLSLNHEMLQQSRESVAALNQRGPGGSQFALDYQGSAAQLTRSSLAFNFSSSISDSNGSGRLDLAQIPESGQALDFQDISSLFSELNPLAKFEAIA